MSGHGYARSEKMEEADLILINTCSIRENAEDRIWGRIRAIGHLKRKNSGILIGLIGCMAERLKEQVIEKEHLVDLVIGPDAYRSLPSLVAEAEAGHKAVNVLLSREETYADISPVRMDKNGVTSFVSIMRGCNNMCSYCVVPYVRGAERSRDLESIIYEVREISDMGYMEVTLLGQNVNSYSFEKNGERITFPVLLEKADPAVYVLDMLDAFLDKGLCMDTEKLIHEVLDRAACKAAIKAGQPLTASEIRQLLADRQLAQLPGRCPHGRPTSISFTLRDLEKQFKRTGF